MSQEAKGKSEFEVAHEIKTLLEALPPEKREMALRWAREAAGLPPHAAPSHPTTAVVEPRKPAAPDAGPVGAAPRQKTLKDFVAEKQPKSDVQFAATVAYFHRFEATEDARKEEITADDLQDGARLAGRSRFKLPSATLNNSVGLGYLDRGSERGKYRLNAVGENLVAMALPGNGSSRAPATGRARRKPREAAKPSGKSPRKRASKK
ncbi:hypothetical protein [Anaeromyxobacter soli]|uniref:hypothetical protein n=1 Tax=Anaeromyxobacter soli TaxID=2922725 RepID=UPI001FAF0C92|nr:hypothetical protein [Anaeromyxobacter sp. SG29]